jgi:hypothetical protein
MLIKHTYPTSMAHFEEFEHRGQRLIRVLIDPRHPRRLQPLMKAVS